MDLTRAEWRKSSRSGGNGGNCVEVAAEWRKSSRSGGNGGDCVEVASNLRGVVAVRDSKNPNGPVLIMAPAGWQDFISDVKAGRHDLA
jgi:hypothetical protein